MYETEKSCEIIEARKKGNIYACIRYYRSHMDNSEAYMNFALFCFFYC